MFFVKSKCAFYVTQTCIKSRQIFDHILKDTLLHKNRITKYGACLCILNPYKRLFNQDQFLIMSEKINYSKKKLTKIL